jgi:hypothetical protein
MEINVSNYLNLPKHGEGHKIKGHLKLLETWDMV